MPIPLTLSIPTITRYSTNEIYNFSSEPLIIKGTNFNANSVVYFYNGSNFLTGTSVVPTTQTSTELVLSNVPVTPDNYSFLVYNSDSELYSNSFLINVKQNVSARPPVINTSKFYTTGVSLSSNPANMASIFANNVSFPANTAFHGMEQHVVGVVAAGKNNTPAGGYVLKFVGRYMTPDTVLFIRDGNNANRYFPLSYNSLYLIGEDQTNTELQHLINASNFNVHMTYANIPPLTLPTGNTSITNVVGVASTDLTAYVPKMGMPYGDHFLVAVNRYGKSNEVPFTLGSSEFTYTSHTNIDDPASYDYLTGTCSTTNITVRSIDNKLRNISRYAPHLFNGSTSVRKREYMLKSSIFNPWDPVKVTAFDADQTCAAFNCTVPDVFPIGTGSGKFMTSSNTVFASQCPVEALGLPGTSDGGPTPAWDAWRLFSNGGASPAIPICENQGELQKQFTIEFATRVQAANFDLTCQVTNVVSNAMTVTIERWNDLTSAYDVVVNAVSTGSWALGANVLKTVAIPAHTVTYRYRITLEVAVDSSLNPTHLMKTARLY